MTATFTLKTEDVAELIATSIGDAIAWLLRWAIILAVWLVAKLWSGCILLAADAVHVAKLGFALSRVAASLARYTWKRRKVRKAAQAMMDEPFITVPFDVEVVVC